MGLPHTGSYYAATANETTDYPALQGDTTTDVCVIGAGFTGIATALTLAERGYGVTVLEANKVGWGASGRNGGQMIGGIAGEKHLRRVCDEETLWAMRWRGHEIIAERVQKYGIDCDLKYGYLDVAIKPRHLREFEADYERMRQHGFAHDHRLLDREQTRSLIGTNAYLGSLLNMANGHLHPLNLCLGEARAAAALGVRIHESTEALHIEYGNKPTVKAANGSVTADFVVIAGNAYHLVEPRLRGVMFPVNSFIIATEPLTEEQVARVNPRDLAICDPNFILQYYRLSADKRFLFGARINYFGDDPGFIRRHHLPLLLRLYPELDGIGVDYAWGGTIGVPLHRVPRIGRVNPNVLYAQGYSGHGVNVTHLAGEVLADAVAGTLERFDMFAGIESVQFPGSHALRKPLVALGILYYQIRDKI